MSVNENKILAGSPLGKALPYDPHYNPELLFAIPRQSLANYDTKIAEPPFFGFDLWNHYEVSWLNPQGKPHVALAQIIYPCDSDYLIESKSMKLYFHSFNNTQFKNISTLEATIQADFERNIKTSVQVKITPLTILPRTKVYEEFAGICLDEIDVSCTHYSSVDPNFLTAEGAWVETETLYSNLLKSNCLVTNQPDWGSVQISYTGKKIQREGLLKYIVSYRNHNEFHEQCIERIFLDIKKYCHPEKLTVYGRYTRRGGIDINPYRTSEKNYQMPPEFRLWRQ